MQCTGGDDVEVEVAIDIAERKRIRSFADSNRRTRRASESAAPVAEDDREIVVRIVGGDEVEFPITVQVARGETVSVRVRAILHHD